METCKDCAYDKMCFLTHESKDLACCEFEPSTISELKKIKEKMDIECDSVNSALDVILDRIIKLKGE